MGKLSNEVEEKCHSLKQENQVLKQQSQEQELKIKRLTSKFAWLLKDFKRDDPALNVSTLELRQKLAESENDLVKLRLNCSQLQNRLRVTQQQAAYFNRRPKINRSYSWVNPRVNSGLQRGRKQRPNSTSNQTLFRHYDRSPPPSAWTSQSPLDQSPPMTREPTTMVRPETAPSPSEGVGSGPLPDKLMAMLEEAQNENRRLRETITSFREKVVTYERAIENFQTRMREREAEFQEELFHARTTQLADARQNTIENVETQRLKRELRQKASYSHELEIQLKDLRQRVEVYEKTVDQLTAENDSLLTKVSAEERRSTSLKLQSDQCSSLQHRVRELNDTVRELMDEIVVLKDTNNKLVANSRSRPPIQPRESLSKEEVNTMNEKVSRLEKELEEEMHRAQELSEKLTEELKTKGDSLSKISDLEVALAIYEDTLRSKDNEIERMQHMLEILDKQPEKESLTDLENELAQIKVHVEGRDIRINELQEEIVHYKEMVHHYEAQMKLNNDYITELSQLKELLRKESEEKLESNNLVESLKAELLPLLENLKPQPAPTTGDKLTIEQLVQTEPESPLTRKVSRGVGSPVTRSAPGVSPLQKHVLIDEMELQIFSKPASTSGNSKEILDKDLVAPVPKPRGLCFSPKKETESLPAAVTKSQKLGALKSSLSSKEVKEKSRYESCSDDDDSDASVESVKEIKPSPPKEVPKRPRLTLPKKLTAFNSSAHEKEQDSAESVVSEDNRRRILIHQDRTNRSETFRRSPEDTRVRRVVISPSSQSSTTPEESETESESVVDRKFSKSENSKTKSEDESQSDTDSQTGDSVSSIQDTPMHVPAKKNNPEAIKEISPLILPPIEKKTLQPPRFGPARKVSSSTGSEITSDTETESTPVKKLPQSQLQIRRPVNEKQKKEETSSDTDTMTESTEESMDSLQLQSISEFSRSSSRSRRRSSAKSKTTQSSPSKVIAVKAEVHMDDVSSVAKESDLSEALTPKPKALQSKLGIRINSIIINRPLPDSRLGSVYVEASYLDFPSTELETESVTFKLNSSLSLGFRAVLDVVGNRRRLLVDCLKKNLPIKFTVVAEPKAAYDDTLDCKDIGFATFSLIEILKQRSDVKNFNSDIYDANNAKIGTLNIGVYAFRLLGSLASEFQ